MSDKEIQCLAVLQDVRDHRIIQVYAVEFLIIRIFQESYYIKCKVTRF